MNHSEETKKKFKFRAGAVYAVLALCVAGVGIATWYSTSAKLLPDAQSETTTEGITAKIDADELTTVPDPVTPTSPDLSEDATPENDGGAENETEEGGVAVLASKDSVARAETFSLPLEAGIAKAYSNGEMVQSKTMGDWRVHNGVDFKGTVGDAVKAINNGVVKAVYDDVLWGTVVEIDHGQGMIAKYCGLGKGSTPEVGEKVKINDRVGNLGTIPIESADDVHLHLEILQDGKAVEPLAAMGKDQNGEQK